jgi:hypothetical protein
MKLIATILLLGIIVVSCNKDKRASKRLIKPGEWEVTKITIGDSSISNLPIWAIQECDIYEDLCEGDWKLDGNTSSFYWQFNDKAKEFVLSRVVAPEDCEDFYTVEVEQHTYKFSGRYKVLETSKSKKIFESTNTIGFEGELVRIEIEN